RGLELCSQVTAARHLYALSLHDALPISTRAWVSAKRASSAAIKTSHISASSRPPVTATPLMAPISGRSKPRMAAIMSSAAILSRSEEHTSELQSRENLVCRLLLEKKKGE